MAITKARFNDANYDDIELYIQAGGEYSEIQLTDKQKQLLDRWRYADERLREHRYTQEQVVKFIMGKYTVCRDTAYRDLKNAERLFISLYPLNKKYEIQNRIEFLKKKIHDQYIGGDPIGASMNEKTLQKYIGMFPETQLPHSPKIIVFEIAGTAPVTPSAEGLPDAKPVIDPDDYIDAEEAYQASEGILKKLEDDDDY